VHPYSTPFEQRMVSSSSECEVTRDPSSLLSAILLVVWNKSFAFRTEPPPTGTPLRYSLIPSLLNEATTGCLLAVGRRLDALLRPSQCGLAQATSHPPHLQPCLAPPSRLPAQLIYKFHLLVKLSLMLSYFAVIMLDVPHLPWK
jgi:hypothetical protein